MNYDRQLSFAKDNLDEELMIACTSTPTNDTIQNISSRISSLNFAWDQLTDALVRQRRERDRIISDLISQLADAKK